MVRFPPLMPSVGWYACFMKALVDTGHSAPAIAKANEGIGTPKEFGRFILFDAKGEKKVESLAIAGGGRQLRTLRNLDTLKLSDHGDWRKVHLGAIESILGRTPFYREIQPALE